uniref:Developmental gene 1062 protein-like n=1 Tax=Dermatophagoides pteronyssinus TaxID=6956 RepID=A0A6P6YCW4_DERPT|nr:developmental gene 1062 protein-like [Dermatophagoides pteronyssinus]
MAIDLISSIQMSKNKNNKTKLDSIQEYSVENSISSTNNGGDETLKNPDDIVPLNILNDKKDFDCDNSVNNHQQQQESLPQIPTPRSSSSSSSSSSTVTVETIPLPYHHHTRQNSDDNADDDTEILETLRQILRMCTKMDRSKRITAMDVYEILSRKSNLIYKNSHSLNNDNDDNIIIDGCESKL